MRRRGRSGHPLDISIFRNVGLKLYGLTARRSNPSALLRVILSSSSLRLSESNDLSKEMREVRTETLRPESVGGARSQRRRLNSAIGIKGRDETAKSLLGARPRSDLRSESAAIDPEGNRRTR